VAGLFIAAAARTRINNGNADNMAPLAARRYPAFVFMENVTAHCALRDE